MGGAIHGDPVPGAVDGLKTILATPGKSAFVITIRTNLGEIAQWLEQQGVPAIADDGSDRRYRHDEGRVLVTRRLMPSALLVHNRGAEFTDWAGLRRRDQQALLSNQQPDGIPARAAAFRNYGSTGRPSSHSAVTWLANRSYSPSSSSRRIWNMGDSSPRSEAMCGVTSIWSSNMKTDSAMC